MKCGFSEKILSPLINCWLWSQRFSSRRFHVVLKYALSMQVRAAPICLPICSRRTLAVTKLLDFQLSSRCTYKEISSTCSNDWMYLDHSITDCAAFSDVCPLRKS